MKLSLKAFKGFQGYRIGAIDGEIGIIKEVYFDDDTWTVRYFIVQTGSWLFGRLTLISTQALLEPDLNNEIFPTNLTMEQIKNGPDIDTDKPLYRQEEARLYDHFPWDIYWGLGLISLDDSVEIAITKKNNEIPSDSDPHLRSSDKVTGYSIHAVDGDLGYVDDFIIELDTWKIVFLIVKTGKLFSGKKIMLPVKLISEINWRTSQAIVDITVKEVENCPEYDPFEPVNAVYEKAVRDYYGHRL